MKQCSLFVPVLLAVGLVAALLPASTSAQAPVYITQWGTFGGGDGQFYDPWGVAVDGSGNVYTADRGNHRIQKFTSSGTYLTQWGTYGTGDGQFDQPIGVVVDGSGNIYVTDASNGRIQKFSNSGTYLTKWGTYGSGDGQFSSTLARKIRVMRSGGSDK
jgi:DNA-binding beta-propeller fold protein YncE